MSQKITPFLWFDKGAEDAAKYYLTVFKNAKIVTTNPMATQLEIEGMQLVILNGGPTFKLNEAFSLMIACESQEEIDYYWNKLVGDGGTESMCGWCKDKYGVSWQVVPSNIGKLLTDPVKGKKAMEAMMGMKKMDLKKLMGE